MMLILGVLAAAALAFTIALSLDGVLPRAPLVKLANFPFRDAPATNGVMFVVACGLALLVARIAF